MYRCVLRLEDDEKKNTRMCVWIKATGILILTFDLYVQEFRKGCFGFSKRMGKAVLLRVMHLDRLRVNLQGQIEINKLTKRRKL